MREVAGGRLAVGGEGGEGHSRAGAGKGNV